MKIIGRIVLILALVIMGQSQTFARTSNNSAPLQDDVIYSPYGVLNKVEEEPEAEDPYESLLKKRDTFIKRNYIDTQHQFIGNPYGINEIPGDVNNDNIVDSSDLSILSAWNNETNAANYNVAADFSLDDAHAAIQEEHAIQIAQTVVSAQDETAGGYGLSPASPQDMLTDPEPYDGRQPLAFARRQHNLGDADGDLDVDDDDLNILLEGWSHLPYGASFDIRADFNGDYLVNDDDLSLLLANFGATYQATPYQLPVGIPDPGFGISQSHMMYEGQYYEAGGFEYKDAGNGPYTHFVDNAHPDATDINNPYGTPDKPRRTIPRDLPEGSVVEVHNGADQNGWNECNITGVGTEEKPIFVRGIDMPRIDALLDVGYYGNAQYIIVDGLSFYKGGVYGRQNGTPFENSYIAIRNSECQGDLNAGGIGIESYTDNRIHHILLSHNDIHDNGNMSAAYDQDVHGITVNDGVNYLWVLDNVMSNNSGDGIQINMGSLESGDIYVGGNIAHHNRQSGFWTKYAKNIVFSQNTAYGHRYCEASGNTPGTGFGFQHIPENVWFMFNESFDNEMGIQTGSNDQPNPTENPKGQHQYLIGNIIHDIKQYTYPNGSEHPYGVGAITMWGGLDVHIVGNTLYNVASGIKTATDAYVVNNIVANVTDADAPHVWIYSPGVETASFKNNLLFQDDGTIAFRWGSHTVDDPALLEGIYASIADNIIGDPYLIDPENSDYRLGADSPALLNGVQIDDIAADYLEQIGMDISEYLGTNIGAYPYVPQDIPIEASGGILQEAVASELQNESLESAHTEIQEEHALMTAVASTSEQDETGGGLMSVPEDVPSLDIQETLDLQTSSVVATEPDILAGGILIEQLQTSDEYRTTLQAGVNEYDSSEDVDARLAVEAKTNQVYGDNIASSTQMADQEDDIFPIN